MALLSTIFDCIWTWHGANIDCISLSANIDCICYYFFLIVLLGNADVVILLWFSCCCCPALNSSKTLKSSSEKWRVAVAILENIAGKIPDVAKFSVILIVLFLFDTCIARKVGFNLTFLLGTRTARVLFVDTCISKI